MEYLTLDNTDFGITNVKAVFDRFFHDFFHVDYESVSEKLSSVLGFEKKWVKVSKIRVFEHFILVNFANPLAIK